MKREDATTAVIEYFRRTPEVRVRWATRAREAHVIATCRQHDSVTFAARCRLEDELIRAWGEDTRPEPRPAELEPALQASPLWSVVAAWLLGEVPK